MLTKDRVIQEARRIFGTHDSAAEAVAASPLGAARPVAAALEAARPRGAARGAMAVAELPPIRRAVVEEAEQEIADGLEAMKKVELNLDHEISDRDQIGLEAIILLAGRPAILIQEGDFMEPPQLWAALKDARAEIKEVIRRVGRIEVANNPNFEWLGTGWLAGRDVVITNRHVAIEFSRRKDQGGWTFRTPMSASMNLRAELGSDSALSFEIRSIVGIHEEHDLAALEVALVSGNEPLPDPLPIASAPPSTLTGSRIYVVGYPAWDGRRNDPEPMRRIFADIYNVKRLQPGEVSGQAVSEFEIFHDCSTLGGNSGSPVVDLETHRVLGLHFGGRFLEKNHAVPLWTLQDDDLVRRAKLNFQ